MTYLSLAVRNELAKAAPLRALLGSSVSWDTWIFDERPINVAVEGTSKCMIVVNEFRPHASRASRNGAAHNTMEFPQITLDIWADPTRLPNKAVKSYDASRKIKDIQKQVDKILHRVDNGVAHGGILIWGTADQVANLTGVAVAASQHSGGPEFSPMEGNEGGMMGRLTYDIHLL